MVHTWCMAHTDGDSDNLQMSKSKDKRLSWRASVVALVVRTVSPKIIIENHFPIHASAIAETIITAYVIKPSGLGAQRPKQTSPAKDQ